MKFWIRINGLQEGPMEIDQTKSNSIISLLQHSFGVQE